MSLDALSDKLMDQIYGKQSKGTLPVESCIGDNCGDALANFLNSGPLKDTGLALPRGGVGPGDLAEVGKARGASVLGRGDLSLDSLTPGTVIHMTRKPGDKNYEYGNTHIGIVDEDEQGNKMFKSFTAGKGWRTEAIDQRFIDRLPAQITATNPVNPGSGGWLAKAGNLLGPSAAHAGEVPKGGQGPEDLATRLTNQLYGEESGQEDLATKLTNQLYGEEAKVAPAPVVPVPAKLSKPDTDYASSLYGQDPSQDIDLSGKPADFKIPTDPFNINRETKKLSQSLNVKPKDLATHYHESMLGLVSSIPGVPSLGLPPPGGYDELGNRLDAEGRSFTPSRSDTSWTQAVDRLEGLGKDITKVMKDPHSAIVGAAELGWDIGTFGLGLISATAAGIERLPSVISKIGTGEGGTILDTYNLMKDRFQDMAEMTDPGKQWMKKALGLPADAADSLVKALGGTPLERGPSEAVGETVMLPLTMTNSWFQGVADEIHNSEYPMPNTEGLLRFMGEGTGFFVMAKFHRGGIRGLKKGMDVLGKEINEFRGLTSKGFARGPDMDEAWRKLAEAKAGEVEGIAIEIAGELDPNRPIIDEVQVAGEEAVKEVEAAKVTPEEQILEAIDKGDIKGAQDIADVEATKSKPLTAVERVRAKKAKDVGKIEDEVVPEPESKPTPKPKVIPTPPERTVVETDPQTSSFRQNPEVTKVRTQAFSERNPRDLLSIHAKALNDVNRWLDGDKEVSIDPVRRLLSDLAAKVEDPAHDRTMLDMLGTPREVELFKKISKESATWARRVKREKGVRVKEEVVPEVTPVEEQIPTSKIDQSIEQKLEAPEVAGAKLKELADNEAWRQAEEDAKVVEDTRFTQGAIEKYYGKGLNELSDSEVISYMNKELLGKGGGAELYSGIPVHLAKKYAEEFYSRARDFISKKLSVTGSGPDMAKMIQAWADKGVLPGKEELKWTDVVPWLQERKGKVTRQEVVDFLEQNKVELRVVEKGDFKTLGKWDVFDPKDGHSVRGFETEGEAEAYANAHGLDYGKSGEGESGTAKFQSFMNLPPDVTNYREFFGVWPVAEHKFDVPTNELVGDPAADINRVFHCFTFDQTINGKKYLMIAELQSAWGLEGRRKGYRGLTELPEGYEVKEIASGKFNVRTPDDKPIPYGMEGVFKSPEEAIAGALKELNALGVPLFPFQKNWMEVAMKKMLRQAAEEGYDGVAWVTGDMVKERYDLSKVYDNVSSEKITKYPSKPGSLEYSVGQNPDNGQFYLQDSKTKRLIGEAIGSTEQEAKAYLKRYQGMEEESWYRVTAKTLDTGSEVEVGMFKDAKEMKDAGIAADMAEKLVAKDSVRLTDADLKLGGEWANKQYDSINPTTGEKVFGMPVFMGKYGKQWGAKVGEGNIDTAVKAKFYHAGEETGAETSGEPRKIHTLDITPSMKETILNQGQYLFSGIPVHLLGKAIKNYFRPSKEELPGHEDFKVGQGAKKPDGKYQWRVLGLNSKTGKWDELNVFDTKKEARTNSIQRAVDASVEWTKLYREKMNDPLMQPEQAIALKKAERTDRRYDEMKAFKEGDFSKWWDSQKKFWGEAVHDQAGRVRSALLKHFGEAGQRLLSYIESVPGGPRYGEEKFRQMTKEVYDDLSKNLTEVLDRYHMYKRFTDIWSYNPDWKAPNGIKRDETLLNVLHFKERNNLSDADFKLIQERSELMFDHARNWVDEFLLTTGIIGPEEAKALKSHDYSKMKYIATYADVFDRSTTSKVGDVKVSNYDSGIDPLGKGGASIAEVDQRIVYNEVARRLAGRAANQRSRQAMREFATQFPDNGMIWHKGLEGKKPKGWVRDSVWDFESPVESVETSYPSRQPIWLHPDFAKQVATVGADMSYRFAWATKLLGTDLVRSLAVGTSAVWATVVNLPIDIMHTFFSPRVFKDGKEVGVSDAKAIYSPFFPKYLTELGSNYIDVAPDVWNRGPKYNAYAKYGGLLQFLTQRQSHITGHMQRPGKFDQLLDILSAHGRNTELLTRISIMDRVVDQKAGELGMAKEELWKRENAKSESEILRLAAHVARENMPYGQTGWMVKVLDRFIPFAGANYVGGKTFWRAAVERPADFSARVANIGATAVGITALSLLYNPKAYREISDNDKERNIVIPFLPDYLKFKDSKGEERTWNMKIPGTGGPMFFYNLFSGLTHKFMYEAGMTNISPSYESIIKSLSQNAPIQSMAPPVISALTSYVTNYSIWQDRNLFTKLGGKTFSWPQSKAEGINDPNVAQLAKSVGGATGLSPTRLQGAVGELIPKNNEFMWLFGKTYEGLFSTVPDKIQERVWQETIAKTPGVNRWFSLNTPDAYRQTGDVSRGVQEEKVEMRNYLRKSEFDLIMEEKARGGEVRDKLRDFYRKVGREDPEAMQRYMDDSTKLAMIEKMEHKAIWKGMLGKSDELKAMDFNERLKVESSPEEQKNLRRELGRLMAAGFVGEKFFEHLGKIRRKDNK